MLLSESPGLQSPLSFSNQLLSHSTPLKSVKVENDCSPTGGTGSSKCSDTSPPKLTKEHAPPANLSHRRVLCKEEGFGGGGGGGVLRSTSEASVFDFRGSESESEMPVLENQQKKATASAAAVVPASTAPPPGLAAVAQHHQQQNVLRPVHRPLSPATIIKQEELTDDEKGWFKLCDELVTQLMNCPAFLFKKKAKRKKKHHHHSKGERLLMQHQQQQQPSLSEVSGVAATDVSDPLSSLGGERCEGEERNGVGVPRPKVTEIVWKRRGKGTVPGATIKKKKRNIGDGSAFSPGWQHEVYRYKESLRMPQCLISVGRPTGSLPDLGDYMDSVGSPGKSATAALAKQKPLLDNLMEKFNNNTPGQFKGVSVMNDKNAPNNTTRKYLHKEIVKSRSRSLKKKSRLKRVLSEERASSAPPAGARDPRKPSPRTKLILRSMLTQRRSKADKRRRRGAEDKRLKPGRRKQLKSSGFDYLKKKKKPSKDVKDKKPRKKKSMPTGDSEVLAEIRSWVLNKGAGETVLHRAARLGYTEVLQYCLDVLDEKPSLKDNAGYTPLHEACSRGHIEAARLLLSCGAQVNDSAQGGITPLHEAAENGFTDVIEVLLLYGADPELASYNGQTPLSLATSDGARQLMESHKKLVEFAEPFPINDDENDNLSVTDSLEGFEIEESDVLLPPLYRLSGEPRRVSWVLLHDLAPLVKEKKRESLLRKMGTTHRDMRELKPSEFYSRARTRSLMMGDMERKPPRLQGKMHRVTLVRYTEAVKSVLGVETTVIPR